MNSISNEPEGATPVDPAQMEGLKFGHVTTREQLNELEQANVQSGLLWIGRRRKSDILTEQFMLELHRRLFGEVWNWAGQFRERETNIGVDPLQIQVQLRMLLDDARYWAEHGTYLPLEAAARFHHRLVQIHPFANGNGRHARIAADIYLAERLKQPPIDWAAGHDLQSDNERRNSYIAALRAADAGDHNLLSRFVGINI
ncbi:MAG: mobile mystery protein B [Afipia sp.]|jgi:Fic-DOC domain mobile mystery protein B|uniref:Mobile mystery protein B n=1 Tax=Afipia broomeae ATCC 49717 TaxID=883078 RepID=K8PAH1_9BRAD|nr:mobile mystery protein B [Afipia broomeae]EKS38551.1 mobile mystery protein B [Afipia broomeae ATCC 49717]MBN9582703.1 mobile mystery protein B [Afipia sp.]MCR6736050.1 mobile mystery protein B [Afipia sp.]